MGQEEKGLDHSWVVPVSMTTEERGLWGVNEIGKIPWKARSAKVDIMCVVCRVQQFFSPYKSVVQEVLIRPRVCVNKWCNHASEEALESDG